MSERADSKKTKDRSPTFPFITLERALERARQFFAEEKRGAAPYTRVVLHWGYTVASSGGLQTLSALKTYGLIDEVGGAGLKRQVRLSDLALRILLDTRPESTDREAYVRQAALTPVVVSEIYEKWPDGLPSDGTLNHYLVLERKFNQATAQTVIKILNENQRFAQLDRTGVISAPTEIEVDELKNQDIQNTAIGTTDPAVQKRSLQAAAVQGKVVAHVEQLLSADGTNGVTFTFTGKPDAAFYEEIGEFATMKALRLKKVETTEKAAPKSGADVP